MIFHEVNHNIGTGHGIGQDLVVIQFKAKVITNSVQSIAAEIEIISRKLKGAPVVLNRHVNAVFGTASLQYRFIKTYIMGSYEVGLVKVGFYNRPYLRKIALVLDILPGSEQTNYRFHWS